MYFLFSIKLIVLQSFFYDKADIVFDIVQSNSVRFHWQLLHRDLCCCSWLLPVSRAWPPFIIIFVHETRRTPCKMIYKPPHTKQCHILLSGVLHLSQWRVAAGVDGSRIFLIIIIIQGVDQLGVSQAVIRCKSMSTHVTFIRTNRPRKYLDNGRSFDTTHACTQYRKCST